MSHQSGGTTNRELNRLTKLREQALSAQLFIDTYSPGDGPTRYRFFFPAPSDYFSGDAIYTAVGYQRAARYVEAFGHGYHLAIADQRARYADALDPNNW